MAQDRAKGLSALRRQRCRLVIFVYGVRCVEVCTPGWKCTCTVTYEVRSFHPGQRRLQNLALAHNPGRAEQALAAWLTAARRRRPRVAAAK